MAVNIDQQFIEYIIKSIVGKPDAVKIERSIDEKGVLLELSVDPEDLGRVIGKRGATAQSLRTLLRALGTKNDARYNLKIIDTDGGGRSHAPAPSTSSDDSTQANDEASSTAAEDQTVSDEIESQHDDERTESENVDAKERMDEVEVEEPEPEMPDETEAPTETDHSSVIDKTRKELADLDDLDI